MQLQNQKKVFCYTSQCRINLYDNIIDKITRTFGQPIDVEDAPVSEQNMRRVKTLFGTVIFQNYLFDTRKCSRLNSRNK